MLTMRNLAVLVLGLTISAALVVIVVRGGLIAWGTFVFGIALLARAWLKPSRYDLGFGVGLALVSTLAWFGTWYYVITTYESGEVVELVIDTEVGAHAVRLWVFGIDGTATVYYDADPMAAESLLAGKPLQFTRAGLMSTRIPRATRVDALPAKEARGVFEAMSRKYGGRMTAADISYLVLGVPRDRVAVIVKLSE